MRNNLSRHSARKPLFEPLEHRTLLTPVLATAGLGRVEHSAIVADVNRVSLATKTLLSVQAGSLGQAITFTVTVRDAASLGPPTGSVTLTDHGVVIQTLTLAPTTSTNARYAFSSASYTIPAGAGGPAYYFGPHTVTAVYTSNGPLRPSGASARFTVAMPRYTTMAGGLKVATVETGSGPGIAAGQTASMLYTGYLARGGSIFDDSDDHGGAPFTFTVDASPEQVIPGFDEGTIGMEVGETRVLLIPSALAYGSAGSSPAIPPNAKLVFLITLEGIS